MFNGRFTILVGALEHEWIILPITIGNVILPTDEVIFFRGVGLKPPTGLLLY
jgi:hypothetical protein